MTAKLQQQVKILIKTNLISHKTKVSLIDKEEITEAEATEVTCTHTTEITTKKANTNQETIFNSTLQDQLFKETPRSTFKTSFKITLSIFSKWTELN